MECDGDNLFLEITAVSFPKVSTFISEFLFYSFGDQYFVKISKFFSRATKIPRRGPQVAQLCFRISLFNQ